MATISKDQLVSCLDQLLAHGTRDDDVRSRALISLRLGKLVEGRLDADHRAALEYADGYWHNTAPEAERLEFLETIGSRLDGLAREGKSMSPEGCANRIVWSALNTNTGLSIFAAEVLVDAALGAGLDVKQVEAAFRAVLPELGETR